MASKTAPQGFSGLQIGLHWAVALLILIQFLASEGIEEAWDTIRDGGAAVTSSTVILHIGVGFAVLAFAAWRLWLRKTRGAPSAPAEEPVPLRFLAAATHALLYALLIILPISGSMAWFGGVDPAIYVHVIGKTVLLVLIGLHVAGAFFQHFVLKTGVLTRMAVPRD
jgi:cytochrome b561